MAELDNDTQAKIKEFEKVILNNGLVGKQTKDIPYHITLCQFPLEDRGYLENLLEKINKKYDEIEITFSGFGLFGLNVLFLNPNMNKELMELFLALKKNSQYENDDLAAHVTLLMDEPENILAILPKVNEKFRPFTGRITNISLYEFFPKQFIKRIDLLPKNR